MGRKRKKYQVKNKETKTMILFATKKCSKLAKKCDASTPKCSNDATLTSQWRTAQSRSYWLEDRPIRNAWRHSRKTTTTTTTTTGERQNLFITFRSRETLLRLIQDEIVARKNLATANTLHHPLASFLHAFSWCNDEHWLNAPETFQKVAPRRRMTS